MRLLFWLFVAAVIYCTFPSLSLNGTINKGRILLDQAWTKTLTPKPVDYAQVAMPSVYDVLADVNYYRKQHGLRPLRYSKTCAKAAELQVRNNMERGECEHYNNDQYPTVKARLVAAGHEFGAHASGAPINGENMLRFSLRGLKKLTATEKIFYQYHNSPVHDAEMLNPNMKYFGTYSAVDESGMLYNGEVFAI